MDFRIRKAGIADLEILQNFEQALIHYERKIEPAIRKSPTHYYDLSAILRSNDAVVFIAEAETKPCACCFAEIRPNEAFYTNPKHGYIGLLFVDEPQRGHNLAGMLITSCIDWFKSQSINDIRLKVYSNNASAQSLYKKLGFRSMMEEMQLSI